MQNSATWRSQILLIMIYCLYHRIIMTYHFSSQSAQFCKPVRSLVWGPLGDSSHTFHCVYSPSEAGPWSYSIFFISLKLFTRPVLKAGQASLNWLLSRTFWSLATIFTILGYQVPFGTINFRLNLLPKCCAPLQQRDVESLTAGHQSGRHFIPWDWWDMLSFQTLLFFWTSPW